MYSVNLFMPYSNGSFFDYVVFGQPLRCPKATQSKNEGDGGRTWSDGVVASNGSVGAKNGSNLADKILIIHVVSYVWSKTCSYHIQMVRSGTHSFWTAPYTVILVTSLQSVKNSEAHRVQ